VQTSDFSVAQAHYRKLFPHSPHFDTWIPASHFLSAEFDEMNLAITRSDSNESGLYGMAFGPAPTISPEWRDFSIESCGAENLPNGVVAVVEWDSYWAPTKSGDLLPAQRSSDQMIDEFLRTHAPQSSVFPGSDEILKWIEIFEGDQLLGVAALCRWQSGRIVISSVATHLDHRGKGVGKRLMESALVAGDQLGEKFLSLGVMHKNESAQSLYAATGFTLMHNFTYCERR
jgi:GNAT superfamily N-acetyltransferase